MIFKNTCTNYISNQNFQQQPYFVSSRAKFAQTQLHANPNVTYKLSTAEQKH